MALVFDDKQQAVLGPFLGMVNKDGTRVRAGRRYVDRLLDFKTSEGAARVRHDEALEHLYKQIEPHTTADQRGALTKLFQELLYEQYTKEEIRSAVRQAEGKQKGQDQQRLVATTS